MLIGRLRKPKPAAPKSDVAGQPATPVRPVPSKKSTASTETPVASYRPSKTMPPTPAVAETAHAATTPALDETSTETPSSPKKKKKKKKGKSGSSTPAEAAHTPTLGETSTGAPSTKKKKKKGKKKKKPKSKKGQERRELVDALKHLVEILARNGCVIEDENGVPIIVFIRNPFGDESGEVDVRNHSLRTCVLIDSSCQQARATEWAKKFTEEFKPSKSSDYRDQFKRPPKSPFKAMAAHFAMWWPIGKPVECRLCLSRVYPF